jgi:DNA-binding MarR family transcriptional regulator
MKKSDASGETPKGYSHLKKGRENMEHEVIALASKIPQSDIVLKLKVDKSYVSRTISKWLRQGLMVEKNPGDKLKLYARTPKGEKAFSKNKIDASSIADSRRRPSLPEKEGIILNKQHKLILSLFNEETDNITSEQVQRILGVGQPTAFYHLEQKDNHLSLASQNILKRIPNSNPAIYLLTPQGEGVLKTYRNSINGCIEFDSSPNTPRSKLRIRAHNIALKISIAREPKNQWALNRFQNVDKDYDMNWPRIQGRFEGNYFLITNKAIVFKPVAVYGHPYQALFKIFELGKQLFQFLIDDNPGLALGDDLVYLLAEEYAFERDAFAVACDKLGVEISNWRFKIDFSKGFPEFELIDPQLSPADASAWKDYNEVMVHKVLDGEIDPNELTYKSLMETKKLLSEVATTQQDLASGQNISLITSQGNLTATQAQIILTRELNRLAANILGVKEGQGKPVEKPVAPNGPKHFYLMNHIELKAYWERKRREQA